MAKNGFIAVHCGAGYHTTNLQYKYKEVCKKACQVAGEVITSGGTAVDACQRAIMIMEANPLTNAGFGSNLTMNGIVECDASIMDGKTLNFGACGATKGVRYPISLATQICKDQSVERPLGLIQPALLVGQGARDYAMQANLELIDNKQMVSREAFKRYKRNKRLVTQWHAAQDNQSEQRLDTVGAVCVDGMRNVCAASSSGGVLLKYNGRIGQAAIYGAGVWAESVCKETENSVAVTTTGTGEYLIKTLLAKEIATNIKSNACPVTGFQKTLKNNFLDSRHLQHIPEKYGGALALHVTPTGPGELIWGHTTKTMGLAYLDTSKRKPIAMISQLPSELEGIGIVVSGINFNLNLT